jgi:hypothetical protein
MDKARPIRVTEHLWPAAIERFMAAAPADEIFLQFRSHSNGAERVGSPPRSAPGFFCFRRMFSGSVSVHVGWRIMEAGMLGQAGRRQRWA